MKPGKIGFSWDFHGKNGMFMGFSWDFHGISLENGSFMEVSGDFHGILMVVYGDLIGCRKGRMLKKPATSNAGTKVEHVDDE